MVLKQKRTTTDVLIIDASKGFVKEGKSNKLRASDIKRMVDAIVERQNIPKYAALVSRDDLRKNEYNLNISRYVDSGEAAESWDIYATMFGGIPINEIEELQDYWEIFPGLRDNLFVNTSAKMAALKTEDVKAAILKHVDTKDFVQKFADAFADFDATLRERLIGQMMTLHVSSEKTHLSAEIFRRLANVPLIDKYEAYQLLDNEWQGILIDLEILQTEGFDAVRQVDANMVTKKVKGEDAEVQDGWKGHVLPFELVQEVHLADDLHSLADKEHRLADIAAELEELLEALSEEIRETAITNDAKDTFVNAEVQKLAKDITSEVKKGAKYGEEDDETRILKVSGLIAEEKTLKKDIKEEAEALNMLTKKAIEALTDVEAKALLERKWIIPLVDALHNLTIIKIATLTEKVSYLAEKYSTTLRDVSLQLQETERTLVEMMGELTGNDHDMRGLNEWRKLLKGEENDKR